MRADNRGVEKLLEAVADGAGAESVDWDRLIADTQHEEDRATLETVRLLAGVARVHRSEIEAPTADEWSSSQHARVIGRISPVAGPSEETTEVGLGSWGPLVLLEKLDEGAFGEVYRALDPKLDRQVALKLLKPVSLSTTELDARLLDESRALARVRHEHVVQVFGAESHDGRVGLWMEFIRGSTLERILQERGPFGPREAALAGQDLCRALAAVHGAGLVHRDVKTQNVMREEGGRLVLMDFGTGQLRDSSDVRIRRAGTPLYIAPEVLAGGPGTEQADIYGLGVLLFRLVTVSYPVRASSVEALAEAHAQHRCTRLGDLRPDLPTTYVRVVDTATDPDPARRYQSAGEMLSALGAVLAEPAVAVLPDQRQPRPADVRPSRPPTRRGVLEALGVSVFVAVVAALAWFAGLGGRFGPADGIQQVAVLPFESLSQMENPIAEGLSEAIAQELARQPSLRVVSRTSTRRAAEMHATASELARMLKADALVEGSVRASDTQVRIHVRLIRAGSDAPEWVRAFIETRASLLGLQNTVAAYIARELGVTLGAGAVRTQSVRPEAYEAYLSGWTQASRQSKAGLTRALELFERAADLDPSYAAPRAGIAMCYLFLGSRFETLAYEDAMRRARESAHEALALDPDLGDAHEVLGAVALDEGDWGPAETELRAALSLNPSLEFARDRYAMLLAARGRLEEALAESGTAIRTNPLSSPAMATHAGILRYAERFDEAVEAARRAVELDPANLTARTALGRNYVARGDWDLAIETYRQCVGQSGLDAFLESEIAQANAGAGRADLARDGLRRIEATFASGEWLEAPELLAYVQVRLGEKDEAFRNLRAALEQNRGSLLWMKVDPRLAPLRGDPRYVELLRAIGVEP
jgi:TolB-like protein/Tfp pilus assembly protein PilF/tRNA A-37 threonylcarbamoyl transferase component Bud32